MRRILLENITGGMKLAKPLYNADGIVLLHAGIELTERFIARLQEQEISYVYIEDDLTQDIDIPDVISEKTRVETIAATKLLLEQIQRGRGVDAGKAKKLANTLVDELTKNRDILLNFTDMRICNDYLYGHSVNVAVLSIMAGIKLQYDELRLRDLGVGALLHDVGQTQVPKDILNKKGRLTQEEAQEVKQHPVYGFEILRKNPDISLISAHCAFQHHERYDGTGYPRNLKESDINQAAHIVAIADVFDALTSDSAYRKAIPVHEALTIINKHSGIYFDRDLVQIFTDSIAVYPIGTVVRLSNNQIGVVVDISRENRSKPVVRIIIDENKKPVDHLCEVDLSKNHQLYIADLVER
jgi:HD-GYP domain-containing protein (c-di-GMP phosphodiesterase class II)